MMLQHMAGLRRVHFVGIGGVGMSGIAEILLDFDLEVSGSDLATSDATRRLESLGASIFEGHDETHVDGADLVVVSSAVATSNVEVTAAQERGVTIVRRAEMLAELMRLKYGIAVAGTHGKTTTTSLIGTVLTDSELDPTVIVGGRLRLTGTGARHGQSDYLVAEADEFDRSFLALSPILAVITNIDEDHLDTYADLAEIEAAFVEFARRVPFFGQVIVCVDDANVQRVLPSLRDRRVLSYGLSPQAELQASEVEATKSGGTRFVVRRRGEHPLGSIDLALPGKHNVQNALAAVAVGLALDLDFERIAKALAGFAGVHRRFERLGQWHGATVIDDYAHHPAEVEATLRAARQVFENRKVFAVFQPHLFSRTQQLAEDFGRALLLADHAVITDIYPSREQPIEGVHADLVVEAAKRSGHRSAIYCGSWQQAPAFLKKHVGEGDAVLTLGAGDVYRLGHSLVSEEEVA